jgi:hypothetical protein
MSADLSVGLSWLENIQRPVPGPAGKEVEVAALVGLDDGAAVERAPAAIVVVDRPHPACLAAGQLVLADQQVEAAVGDVETDDVAVADQRQRPADGGLRRDI